MKKVFDNLNGTPMVISFNNEAYISREQMETLLRGRGELEIIEIQHNRYVGAKIGIYNLLGEKVGKISHVKNVEYLFIVNPRRVERKTIKNQKSMDLFG